MIAVEGVHLTEDTAEPTDSLVASLLQLASDIFKA